MPDFPTKRLFFALQPDDAARADLLDAVADLADVEGLKLTPAENLHVTVKFLGNVPDPEIPDVIEVGRAAAAPTPPFELNTEGVRLMPRPRAPRVLAAALDCPPPLTALVDALEQRLADLGFQREGRAFRPHITLGRFKFGKGRSARPPRDWTMPPVDLPPTGFPVHALTLLSSDLDRTGPTYAELARLPLEAAPDAPADR